MGHIMQQPSPEQKPLIETDYDGGRRARFKYIVVLIAGLVVCVVYALILSNLQFDGERQAINKPLSAMELQEIKSVLQERLPIGSSKTQVIKWLKDNKINYRYIDGGKTNLNYEATVVSSGFSPNGLGGFFEAALPQAHSDNEIRFVFFMDKKVELVKATVNKTEPHL